MRSLKLKFVDDGRVHVQNPLSQLGLVRRWVITFQIDNIPPEIPDSEVVRLANGTFFSFDHLGHGKLRYDFNELGIGRIA